MKTLLFGGMLAAFFVAGPALAGEPAKPGHLVDMTAVLMDDAGRPARDTFAKEPVPAGKEDADPKCDKCPVLRLGLAVSHALFAAFPDDKDSPDQKWARAVLAQRVKEEKAAQLSAEEISVIKRQLGRAYGGIVLMQAFPLLDPNAKPPEVK